MKKDIPRNFTKFTGKRLCQSLFFNKVAGLRPANWLKKETLAQVFSCEFCEISKLLFIKVRCLINVNVSLEVNLEGQGW